MTCRAMRLRLLPWVWERLELPPPRNVRGETYERKLGPIAKTFHANVFLAASVKYFWCFFFAPGSELIRTLSRFMTVNLPLDGSALRSFVKCLKSLPNLHTLEIKCSESSCHTTPLKKALKGVQFPQIKTLILPLTAHPLLRHCCDVEDVVHAVEHGDISPDEFFGSLASMRDSKVERLTIPAASLDNQLSRKCLSILWGHIARTTTNSTASDLRISGYVSNAHRTNHRLPSLARGPGHGV